VDLGTSCSRPPLTATPPYFPPPPADVDLGTSFMRCATLAQQRNMDRKAKSLAQLAMPDGRYVDFTKAARKAIPEAVMEAIRWADGGSRVRRVGGGGAGGVKCSGRGGVVILAQGRYGGRQA